jgi:hypothetical protein
MVGVISLSHFLHATLTIFFESKIINRLSNSFFRLWTNPTTETSKSFAGTCKKCAMAACPPGQILPKEPGLVLLDCAANTNYSYHRAVSGKRPECYTINVYDFMITFAMETI